MGGRTSQDKVKLLRRPPSLRSRRDLWSPRPPQAAANVRPMRRTPSTGAAGAETRPPAPCWRRRLSSLRRAGSSSQACRREGSAAPDSDERPARGPARITSTATVHPSVAPYVAWGGRLPSAGRPGHAWSPLLNALWTPARLSKDCYVGCVAGASRWRIRRVHAQSLPPIGSVSSPDSPSVIDEDDPGAARRVVAAATDGWPTRPPSLTDLRGAPFGRPALPLRAARRILPCATPVDRSRNPRTLSWGGCRCGTRGKPEGGRAFSPPTLALPVPAPSLPAHNESRPSGLMQPAFGGSHVRATPSPAVVDSFVQWSARGTPAQWGP